MAIIFNPIGIIKTEFERKEGIPIQAIFGENKRAFVEIYEKYADGLKDLEGFSHIHLLYYFDRHSDYKMHVKPYLSEELKGIFATRASTITVPVFSIEAAC